MLLQAFISSSFTHTFIDIDKLASNLLHYVKVTTREGFEDFLLQFCMTQIGKRLEGKGVKLEMSESVRGSDLFTLTTDWLELLIMIYSW